jgi:hypothetical protein
MLTKHEKFILDQWENLLKREDLIGGDVRIHEKYYGNIIKIEDKGTDVRITATWCARITKSGWSRRNEMTFYLQKNRLTDETSKAVESGQQIIYFAGHGVVKEDAVHDPIARNDPDARLRLKPVPPLFAAAGMKLNIQKRPKLKKS